MRELICTATLCTVFATTATGQKPPEPPSVVVDDRVEIRFLGKAREAYKKHWQDDPRNIDGPDSLLSIGAIVTEKRGEYLIATKFTEFNRGSRRPTVLSVSVAVKASEFMAQPPFTDEEAKQKRLPQVLVDMIRKRRDRPVYEVSDPARVQVKKWVQAPTP
ncbi:MAG: hypothetical protein AAGJ40_23800 [Planctomycetota bacterium]